MIGFSWYRCNNVKPNVEIAIHAVSMAKAFGNKKYIALSLWCLRLGNTYHYLGEIYAGYDNLQEAYQMYNAQVLGDLKLQRICCLCGIDMVNEARLTFEDGDKVASLARDVVKQAATVSDDDVHARSLVVLARVLDDFGD